MNLSDAVKFGDLESIKVAIRAVARALIGGVYIHIFRSSTSFFGNKVDFKRSQSGRT